MGLLSGTISGRFFNTGAAPTDRVILDQDSFHRAISLERKRTERSNRLFLLMLLDVSRLHTRRNADEELHYIFTSLSGSIRETDIVGWHKHRAVLGIIFSEISSERRPSIISAMLLRVRGVLYGILGFDCFNQISITYHLFPEEWAHDVPQCPSHPSLYPDLSSRTNKSRSFFIIKRAVDIIGSSVGLLLGIPLFLIIALAIKLSSKGPVLFRQIRVGQYGTPFVFLKFRSMCTGNDSRVHREYVDALIRGRAERNSPTGNGEKIFKLTKDLRVTRVGAFLRKTSLDELPQLYNVLKGEMSLVGPRPPIPYEMDAYECWHRRRVLEAKPGITGLWQVKGRSRVTFDEMVRLDVQYATTRSLWLDIVILLQTPVAVILGGGAC